MSRTNPIGFLLGLFFIAWLVVLWLWMHEISYPIQIWVTWLVLLYGSSADAVKIGVPVKTVVLRDGERVEITVTPEPRPN